MLADDLFEVLDSILPAMGRLRDLGEEYAKPSLEILAYYRGRVRLHWLPWLGTGLSVVAVIRQPVDIASVREGYLLLLKRVLSAVQNRYPSWRWETGPALGLTVVVLTSDPIAAGDDEVLESVLAGFQRSRAVLLGLLRLNLGQEAMTMALRKGPDDLFPEPQLLAEALSLKLKRYVPLFQE